jgi:MFS family permease
MALSIVFFRDLTAGVLVVVLLGFFSLARGLVSVASKDVTGKTIPKTRRGRLTGYTTAVSGVLLVILGGALIALVNDDSSTWVLALLLFFAALLWVVAGGVFATVRETPGATGGGKDALREAFARLDLLRTDAAFRRFVWVRALLVSTGLSAPFYLTLARESSRSVSLLAFFVLASGLASALSSGFWGRYSDRSSRSVLVLAALVAASLGTTVFLLDLFGTLSLFPWFIPLAYFFLSIAHGGVRVGRKTYLLDMASGERRTDYVAVSNSVIGAVLLLGGALGLLAPLIGSGGMILLLSTLGFLGAMGGRSLPETQSD